MPLILVVDDEAMVLEVIRDSLVLDGYDVEIALSGADALGLCGARALDLAIVDLKLRGRVSGTTLAEELAKRGVPVLMTSGALEGESEMERLPYPFLLKPFAPATIRALIEETLAKRP